MPPRIRRRITSSRREEIENEQDVMSRAIVRPFDVVSNLPVSFNPPPNGQYETVMKSPLTIKDSAVFYRSLMKSRYNYVHVCPMFELYWVKQSSYARKLVEQDRPLPKSMKDEAFGDREPVLGSEFSARDVMVKLCDASISIGPHEFAIRLFIAKDDRSEKPTKSKEAKLSASEKSKSSNTEDIKPSNEPICNNTSTPKAPQKQEQTSPATTHAVPHVDQNTGKTPSEEKEGLENETKKPDIPPILPKNQNDTGVKGPKPSKASTPSKPTLEIEIAPTKPTQLTNSISQQSLPAPPPPLSPPVDPNNMQSIENTIMISNLNAIARTDESLNKLMKIVALGSASPQQISTFQGYIKQAREMGPQAHHSYLFNPTNRADDPTSKQSKEKKTYKERKPKEKKEKLPKDQKLTAFQEKYYVGATILFEFVENSNVRFKIPQDAIMEVLEHTKEQKQSEGTETETRDILMSFMWIHNRKEMNAFKKKLEAYNEKVAAAQPTTKDKPEQEADAQKGESPTQVQPPTCDDKTNIVGTDKEESPCSAQLNELSNTISESEQKADEDPSIAKEPKESVEKLQEDSMMNGRSENPAAILESVPSSQSNEASAEIKEIKPAVSRSTRSRNYSNNTKKAPSKQAASKKLERPKEPEARYTAVSFTLRGIPHRFVPIILNSAKPLDTVSQEMTHLIQNGFRLPHFYLWYQIDGRLDEALGDGIRQELISEEKKMTGISSASTEKPTAAQQAEKKRKSKEKADERAKRLKLQNANGRELAAEPIALPTAGKSVAENGNTVTDNASTTVVNST